jgi:Ca2+-binding RTX toxin-like protein
MSLEAAVPSSFVVTRSHIQIAGNEAEGITLNSHQTSAGLVSLSVIGDQISGHGNPESGSGIEIDLAGAGTTRADLLNDSIWDIASCNCGASAGILLDPQDAAIGDINVVGMSVERSRSEALYVLNESKSGGRMTLDLFNNIFSHAMDGAVGISSSAGVASRVTLSAGENDYYGDGFPNQLEGRSPGTGNLALLPHYVNGLKGDLRLTSTSPLIDKGIVCSPGGVANPDAAGLDRLAGATVDLGAYEFGAAPVNGLVRLGTAGNDNLNGSSGNDILCGYDGNDRIFGMAGNDFIDGGNGNDIIDGGAGNDILVGGAGNDRLIGDSGSDHLYGGDGNDTLCANDGIRGNDHLDGGAGFDGYREDPGDIRTGVEHTTTC